MEYAVVIPTLNEGQNIGPLLDAVLAVDARLHAIVVDDGSRDGTIEAVQQRESTGRVQLIARGKKMGYASAVQDGMRLALKDGANWILQMDADWSHDPKYLPAILAKSASCDLVIGSRYIPGGGTQNWGIDRKVLSAGANALARTILRLPIRDTTGGFRCWRRDLLEKARVLEVDVQGYAFLFVTADRCRRIKARFGEVPIIFVDRQYGKSKMSRAVIFEAVRVLGMLGLLHFTGRSPDRFLKTKTPAR
ncbi:MAG TPA: polyprenol monophosphomannose synthase [Abditibacteriaceae bacterium]|jgi:dolichol-phosphate mannosyltransferase